MGVGFRDGEPSPQRFACVSLAYAAIIRGRDDYINNAPRNADYSGSAETTIGSESTLNRNS